MRTYFAFLVVLTLALGVARGATDCTVDTLATLETDDGTYYVYNEACQLDTCLFSVWIVEETNGEPGLQKSGEEFEPESCGP